MFATSYLAILVFADDELAEAIGDSLVSMLDVYDDGICGGGIHSRTRPGAGHVTEAFPCCSRCVFVNLLTIVEMSGETAQVDQTLDGFWDSMENPLQTKELDRCLARLPVCDSSILLTGIFFPVSKLERLTIFSPFIIREEMVARARDKVFTESLESLLPVALLPLLPLLLQVLLFLLQE
ncbi:hypothetical protein BDV33DRAFT_204861 [Aspergillus novoparasiticus]|uniref:Uncharacterized protein n=1 Tax=Aspergillus novoparasiticus TaxID=986946 RepID=A0A5N6ENK6_9EURO|nr:hypothetical protein BDV33DRAFT_204861 [Aspergillus novoparasiticus]